MSDTRQRSATFLTYNGLVNTRLLPYKGNPAIVDDVIRLFLGADLGKSRSSDATTDASLKAQARDCLARPNEELPEWFRSYLEAVGDTGNPTAVWTIGRGGDRRCDHVYLWVRAVEVPLGAFYSNGVNQRIDPDLRRLGGSIAAFAPSAHLFPSEFPRLDTVPPDDEDARTLIGVLSKADFVTGRIELIDGFHRAVSLVRQGVGSVSAYLALTFEP